MKEAWKPWIARIACCLAQPPCARCAWHRTCGLQTPGNDALQKPVFAPKGTGCGLLRCAPAFRCVPAAFWHGTGESKRILYALLAETCLLSLWAYALLGLTVTPWRPSLMAADCLCALCPLQRDASDGLYRLTQVHGRACLCLSVGGQLPDLYAQPRERDGVIRHPPSSVPRALARRDKQKMRCGIWAHGRRAEFILALKLHPFALQAFDFSVDVVYLERSGWAAVASFAARARLHKLKTIEPKWANCNGKAVPPSRGMISAVTARKAEMLHVKGQRSVTVRHDHADVIQSDHHGKSFYRACGPFRFAFHSISDACHDNCPYTKCEKKHGQKWRQKTSAHRLCSDGNAGIIYKIICCVPAWARFCAEGKRRRFPI